MSDAELPVYTEQIHQQFQQTDAFIAEQSRPQGRLKRMTALLTGSIAFVTLGANLVHADEANNFTDAAAPVVVPYLSAGETLRVNFPEAVGAKSEVLNLTATNTAADGYITAYDCGALPTKSALNTHNGQDTPNLAIVKAAESGDICFYTNTATDLIVDPKGTIKTQAFANERTDTRLTGQRLPAGGVLSVHVPEATGGKVVLGNLTSVNTQVDGYVTAYPCDQPRPFASDLNAQSQQIASNMLAAKASANGDVCFYSQSATDLVVDIDSVAVDAAGTPVIDSYQNRRVDTRSKDSGTPSPLAANTVMPVYIPEATGGKGVIGNITTDNTRQNGYVTGYACDQPRPVASNLNSKVNMIQSSRIISQAGQDGSVCLYTNVATDVVADFNGLVLVDFYPGHRTDTRTMSHTTPPPTTTQPPSNGQPYTILSYEGSFPFNPASQLKIDCYSNQQQTTSGLNEFQHFVVSATGLEAPNSSNGGFGTRLSTTYNPDSANSSSVGSTVGHYADVNGNVTVDNTFHYALADAVKAKHLKTTAEIDLTSYDVGNKKGMLTVSLDMDCPEK